LTGLSALHNTFHGLALDFFTSREKMQTIDELSLMRHLPAPNR
jgi:hypothetical protein